MGGKKKDKQNKKAKSKKKLKKEGQKSGPVVTMDRIREINRDAEYTGNGFSLNPIGRALNAISQVARDKSLYDRPEVLILIGLRLNLLIPEGYEGCWDPPLTAQQLKWFLVDEESVEFVRKHRPGTLGPITLQNLANIARVLLLD